MTRRSQLRVYYGPHHSGSVPLHATAGDQQGVEVALHELMSTLEEAASQGRTWLEDFRDEQVTISTDLYEIITAYQRLKHSA